jgi:hypothetical protein
MILRNRAYLSKSIKNYFCNGNLLSFLLCRNLMFEYCLDQRRKIGGPWATFGSSPLVNRPAKLSANLLLVTTRPLIFFARNL